MNKNKDNAGLPVQPPLLMSIFLVVALLFGWKLPVPIPCPWWMQVLGGLIVLAGLTSALSAVSMMRRANTSPDPRKASNALVTDGPYKISRNPIYLGYLMILIGLPLIPGYYWGAILAPVALDAYNRLIIEREEGYLEKRFGQTYLGYKAGVRRWL